MKKFLLNDLLIEAVGSVEDRSILELGAGNGYFAPLLFQRYSGQRPSSIVITDVSEEQLRIAQRHFRVPHATYDILDFRAAFPLASSSFDLVLAAMVFNEIPLAGLRRGLQECQRVLTPGGQLLAAVVHPELISHLNRRGVLRSGRGSAPTMPGSGGLRLPVQKTSRHAYEKSLTGAGFEFHATDVFATPEVLRAKPGLKSARKVPLALVFDCRAAPPR